MPATTRRSSTGRGRTRRTRPTLLPAGVLPGDHAARGFGVGVALGVAWGYAWGNCNWGHGDVDIDINRNVNRNNNIDRDRYQNQMGNRGQGSFQHDAAHRRGVGYGDSKTAKQYNRGKSPTAGSRDAYRGRTGSGGSDRAGGAGTRPSTGKGGQTPHARQPSAQQSGRSSAFGGYTNGNTARQQSARGQSSRQSYNSGRSSGGSRGGGSRGGGSRGGGGGRGGGGRR